MKSETISFCPQCQKIVSGTIFFEDQFVKLKIICPEHGEQINTLSNNQNFYQELKNIVDPVRSVLEYDKETGILKTDIKNNIITTVHINLTDRCNLHCKDCFAASTPGKIQDNNDISIENILTRLFPFNRFKHKPMIVIVGGEPTLRSDLPKVIHELRIRGFNVRLSTNGLRLVDINYVKELANAGLQWLLLQFDGFEASDSVALRGVDYIREKMQVIINAQRCGLKMHLMVMVAKNVNANEMLKILNFAFNTDFIYAVNFYPESKIGRYLDTSFSEYDCITKLDSLSNGAITHKDFIECKKLWTFLYKIVKHPILRQKICTFPIFFYRYKNVIYPINRLFKIKTFFLHPVFTMKYLVKCLQLLTWAEKPTKDFVYFSIEKFFDAKCMDLNEAYNCHNVYLTSKGLIPLCIYNVLYRKLNLACS